MPAGRPRKEIKKDTFEKLCGMMCTEVEICGFFGVTDKTLNRWCRETYQKNFSEIHKTVSMDGKISLRRMQFKLAEKNAAMAIFLGKQYLNQSDNPIVADENYINAANKNMKSIADLINYPLPDVNIEDIVEGQLESEGSE